jgi:hypothetical protein
MYSPDVVKLAGQDFSILMNDEEKDNFFEEEFMHRMFGCECIENEYGKYFRITLTRPINEVLPVLYDYREKVSRMYGETLMEYDDEYKHVGRVTSVVDNVFRERKAELDKEFLKSLDAN